MADEQKTKINILFLAAEADPLVKVGGLGDVASSLPRALRALAESETGGQELDVRLAIPFHSVIKEKIDQPLSISRFNVRRRDIPIEGQVYFHDSDGLPIYLVDGPPIQIEAPIYSLTTALDGERYTFFSLGVLEAIRRIGWKPDIIHAHDWHTAIAVYWLFQNRKQDEFWGNVKTILTIHNLPFMGGGTHESLAAYNIPPVTDERLPDWARYFPLPMGLLAADKVTAVSPTYAHEILTREFGSGLQDLLRLRRRDISGILNGLDQSVWDPSTDETLTAQYDVSSLEKRELNKRALLNEVGLMPEVHVPLFIFIGRMDPQKGIDIALNTLRNLSEIPWQAIILGSGVPGLEDATRKFEEDFPGRVKAILRYDANLSRRMYGGADVILMPSRYEPCGLAQMIAMRYGCIPLARATGGLRDSILDSGLPQTSTGFLFKASRSASMEETLRRAIDVYRQPSAWRVMQTNAMRRDFSWRRSAARYATLYNELIQNTQSDADIPIRRIDQ